jgi:hypothetical protein
MHSWKNSITARSVLQSNLPLFALDAACFCAQDVGAVPSLPLCFYKSLSPTRAVSGPTWTWLALPGMTLQAYQLVLVQQLSQHS